MPATTQHLLGQLADGRFPLRKLLGVSQNSAVFLTTVEPAQPGDPPADAAIKLIPEDPATSDLQLERWRTAATLSHPGLLRILHFGRCAIDGASCLYIVFELADEDLGQLLPRRALTPDEANGMLAAILPTLDFLHENGFVHGGVKPSNIHATGDNVKLSVDRISSAGESAAIWPLAAPFAPPDPLLFPAFDMWALGVSICETLTKAVPEQRPSGRFIIPELPTPYSQIVHSALVGDVTLRITLDEARTLLDPSFVPRTKVAPQENSLAASADSAPDSATGSAPDSVPHSASGERYNSAANDFANDSANRDPNAPAISSPYVRPPEAPDSPESFVEADHDTSGQPFPQRTSREPLPDIDPLSVPLSPVSPGASPASLQPSRAPIPVTSLPQVNATIGSSRRVITPNPTPRRPNKLFIASITAAAIFAIIFIPRLFLRSQNSAPANSASSAANTAANSSSASERPTGGSAGTSSPKSTSAPLGSSSTKKIISAAPPIAPSGNSHTAISSPPPSTLASNQPVPNTATANPSAPVIVHKAVPEISSRARSSIRGTVRVNVRVQINPDGSVSTAELANPAPSQFFAAAALKAAREWRFAPPSSSSSASSSAPSQSAPSRAPASSTIIRFDFSPTSTSAYLP